MGLSSALVDKARRISETATAEKVDGTTIFTPTTGAWFKARLTLEAAPESDDPQGGVRRTERTATLMYSKRDAAHNAVVVVATDKIEVNSKALGTTVFEVVGDPEPLRKKRRVIGFEVPLSLISEHPFTAVP